MTNGRGRRVGAQRGIEAGIDRAWESSWLALCPPSLFYAYSTKVAVEFAGGPKRRAGACMSPCPFSRGGPEVPAGLRTPHSPSRSHVLSCLGLDYSLCARRRYPYLALSTGSRVVCVVLVAVAQDGSPSAIACLPKQGLNSVKSSNYMRMCLIRPIIAQVCDGIE